MDTTTAPPRHRLRIDAVRRGAPAVAAIAASLLVAACGGSASANPTAARTGASPQAGRRAPGAAGELVRITGSTLVLSTQNGDVTVDVPGGTPVTRTRTGTVADITPGSCIIATGQKDATGALTASTVRLSPAMNGSCSGAGLFGDNGGAPRRTPNPNRTPPPGFTPPAFVRGEVSAVNGTAVTVRATDGSSSTITVPTTVSVSVSATAAFGDLATGDCVLATGQRSSSGTVTARSLSIVPAGPSGCFTGGGRGGLFGGGGGGFRGGRGGGAGFGGPPAGGGPTD